MLWLQARGSLPFTGGGDLRFDPAVLAQAYLEPRHQPETECQPEPMRS
jgi:hypothetical protein